MQILGPIFGFLERFSLDGASPPCPLISTLFGSLGSRSRLRPKPHPEPNPSPTRPPPPKRCIQPRRRTAVRRVPRNRYPNPQPGRRSLAPDTTVRALPALTRTIKMPTRAYARRPRLRAQRRPAPHRARPQPHRRLSARAQTVHRAPCPASPAPSKSPKQWRDWKTSARATAPGPEQGQLNRYRDWMAKHVEPVVLDAIRCEGFWATDRARDAFRRRHASGS